MNPYEAYRQRSAPAHTRIDTVLSLYETLIDRIEKAIAAVERKDDETAKKQVAACTLAAASLMSASVGRVGELAVNLQRLLDFVIRQLAAPTPANLKSAALVLRTLHEGFAGIRERAIKLERDGEIPPIADGTTFQLRA
jgi:flagellin-specific chaperone FliS